MLLTRLLGRIVREWQRQWEPARTQPGASGRSLGCRREARWWWVTASDPGGLSTELRAAVTVQRLNQGPEAVGSIPDQTVPAGQTVTIDASLYFSDPDGDVLTYAATSTSIAVAVPSVAGSTLTIAGVAPGMATVTVTVTATDPGGLTATQSVNVNVGARSRDREALDPNQA